MNIDLLENSCLIDCHYFIVIINSASLLFLFVGVPSDPESSSSSSNKISGVNNAKPNRPSLAKILLSIDGNLAKQQALSHVLTALQIMYAR